MKDSMWLVFALLGAVFAALVNVVCKRALDSVDFLVGLTIQAMLAVVTLATIGLAAGRWSKLKDAPRGALGLMAVSGVLVGLAWAFGYRALQMADVNRASPIDKLSLPIAVLLAMIFLRERPTVVNWVGIGLMLVGAICVARSGHAGGNG